MLDTRRYAAIAGDSKRLKTLQPDESFKEQPDTMKSMKFETIKLKAQQEFCRRTGAEGFQMGMPTTFLALIAAVGESPQRTPRAILKDWQDYGIKLISNWDIRRVKKLIELFPSCAPQYFNHVPLECDMDDEGDWAVFPSSPQA